LSSKQFREVAKPFFEARCAGGDRLAMVGLLARHQHMINGEAAGGARISAKSLI